MQWRFYVVSLLILGNLLTWYVVVRETRNGVLTVAFLDVGQGDGIYIEAPNGNQLLLDGGGDKTVLRSLGKVMPFYDRSIDLLAVSHPHKDHLAGLDEVLQRYDVGAVLSSGMQHGTAEYKLWGHLIEVQGKQEIIARRGMKINMGGGVVLDVLLPNQDVSQVKEVHDGMLVLQLHYGKTAVMFTGDMEEPFEKYLVAFNGATLKSDVLKVGHHGSRTSTSEAFLGYVAPTYAVISLGAKNEYGHPHKETLAILHRFQIPIFRTDERGTIVMKSDGERILVP